MERVKSAEQIQAEFNEVSEAFGLSNAKRILPSAGEDFHIEDLANAELRRAVYLEYFRKFRSVHPDNVEINEQLLQRLEMANLIRDAFENEDSQISKLFSHQKTCFGDLANFIEENNDKGWIKMPTGAGKTAVFSALAGILGVKTVVLVPKINLINQTVDEIKQFGGENIKISTVGDGVCDTSGDVVICTYQSLQKLLDSGEKFPLVICDEFHRSYSELRKGQVESIPGQAFCLGLSATPSFDEERNASAFGEMIHELTITEAIASNIISGARVMLATTNIDISNVNKTKLDGYSGEEYNQAELSKAIDCEPRNQAIIKLLTNSVIGNQTTAISCVSTKHAENLCKLATEAGLKASYVHSKLSADECEIRREQLANGEIQFLFFVDQLTEGWNCPRASVLVNARPTGSVVVAEQRGGRVLRNYIDENGVKKEYGLIIEVLDQGSRPILFSDILGGTFELPAGVGKSGSSDREEPDQIEISSDMQLILDLTLIAKTIENTSELEQPLELQKLTTADYIELIKNQNLREARLLSAQKFFTEHFDSDKFKGNGRSLVRDYFRTQKHLELEAVGAIHHQTMIKELFDANTVYTKYNSLHEVSKEQMLDEFKKQGITKDNLDALHQKTELLNLPLGTFWKRFENNSELKRKIIKIDGVTIGTTSTFIAKSFNAETSRLFKLRHVGDNIRATIALLALLEGEDANQLAKEYLDKKAVSYDRKDLKDHLANLAVTPDKFDNMKCSQIKTFLANLAKGEIIISDFDFKKIQSDKISDLTHILGSGDRRLGLETLQILNLISYAYEQKLSDLVLSYELKRYSYLTDIEKYFPNNLNLDSTLKLKSRGSVASNEEAPAITHTQKEIFDRIFGKEQATVFDQVMDFFHYDRSLMGQSTRSNTYISIQQRLVRYYFLAGIEELKRNDNFNPLNFLRDAIDKNYTDKVPSLNYLLENDLNISGLLPREAEFYDNRKLAFGDNFKISGSFLLSLLDTNNEQLKEIYQQLYDQEEKENTKIIVTDQEYEASIVQYLQKLNADQKNQFLQDIVDQEFASIYPNINSFKKLNYDLASFLPDKIFVYGKTYLATDREFKLTGEELFEYFKISDVDYQAKLAAQNLKISDCHSKLQDSEDKIAQIDQSEVEPIIPKGSNLITRKAGTDEHFKANRLISEIEFNARDCMVRVDGKADSIQLNDEFFKVNEGYLELATNPKKYLTLSRWHALFSKYGNSSEGVVEASEEEVKEKIIDIRDNDRWPSNSIIKYKPSSDSDFIEINLDKQGQGTINKITFRNSDGRMVEKKLEQLAKAEGILVFTDEDRREWSISLSLFLEEGD